MIYSIHYEKSSNPNDLLILTDGISQHAKSKKGMSGIEPFAFFVYDDQHKIKGGCNGAMYYNCLHIDQLWIDENLRNQSFGTKLIQAAEKLAQENHCTFVTVNTMDWEALGFYQKLGYEIEFERKGYKNNSVMHFLRKNF